MKSLYLGLIPLLLCAFSCSQALADVVHLKDGRQLVGETEWVKDGSFLKIKTRLGEIEFPKAEVLRVESKPLPKPRPKPERKPKPKPIGYWKSEGSLQIPILPGWEIRNYKDSKRQYLFEPKLEALIRVTLRENKTPWADLKTRLKHARKGGVRAVAERISGADWIAADRLIRTERSRLVEAYYPGGLKFQVFMEVPKQRWKEARPVFDQIMRGMTRSAAPPSEKQNGDKEGSWITSEVATGWLLDAPVRLSRVKRDPAATQRAMRGVHESGFAVSVISYSVSGKPNLDRMIAGSLEGLRRSGGGSKVTVLSDRRVEHEGCPAGITSLEVTPKGLETVPWRTLTLVDGETLIQVIVTSKSSAAMPPPGTVGRIFASLRRKP